MSRSEPLGVGGLLPGNISNTAELPLKRGKLKTIKVIPPDAVSLWVALMSIWSSLRSGFRFQIR